MGIKDGEELAVSESKDRNYEGMKCMVCEAGEIMQDDTCNECGCLMVADL